MVRKKNPLLEKKFQEGMETQRIRDIAIFAVRLQRIGQVEGIGPKRLAMINEVLERPFTEEENKKVLKYERKLRGD